MTETGFPSGPFPPGQLSPTPLEVSTQGGEVSLPSSLKGMRRLSLPATLEAVQKASDSASPSLPKAVRKQASLTLKGGQVSRWIVQPKAGDSLISGRRLAKQEKGVATIGTKEVSFLKSLTQSAWKRNLIALGLGMIVGASAVALASNPAGWMFLLVGVMAAATLAAAVLIYKSEGHREETFLCFLGGGVLGALTGLVAFPALLGGGTASAMVQWIGATVLSTTIGFGITRAVEHYRQSKRIPAAPVRAIEEPETARQLEQARKEKKKSRVRAKEKAEREQAAREVEREAQEILEERPGSGGDLAEEE